MYSRNRSGNRVLLDLIVSYRLVQSNYDSQGQLAPEAILTDIPIVKSEHGVTLELQTLESINSLHFQSQTSCVKASVRVNSMRHSAFLPVDNFSAHTYTSRGICGEAQISCRAQA